MQVFVGTDVKKIWTHPFIIAHSSSSDTMVEFIIRGRFKGSIKQQILQSGAASVYLLSELRPDWNLILDWIGPISAESTFRQLQTPVVVRFRPLWSNRKPFHKACSCIDVVSTWSLELCSEWCKEWWEIHTQTGGKGGFQAFWSLISL